MFFRIPEFDSFVITTRRNSFVVGAKLGSSDPITVTIHWASKTPRWETKYFYCFIIRSCQQHSAITWKRNAANSGGVSCDHFGLSSTVLQMHMRVYWNQGTDETLWTHTFGSHSLTVRSLEADAIRLPVGEYVTSFISAWIMTFLDNKFLLCFLWLIVPCVQRSEKRAAVVWNSKASGTSLLNLTPTAWDLDWRQPH